MTYDAHKRDRKIKTEPVWIFVSFIDLQDEYLRLTYSSSRKSISFHLGNRPHRRLFTLIILGKTLHNFSVSFSFFPPLFIPFLLFFFVLQILFIFSVTVWKSFFFYLAKQNSIAFFFNLSAFAWKWFTDFFFYEKGNEGFRNRDFSIFVFTSSSPKRPLHITDDLV